MVNPLGVQAKEEMVVVAVYVVEVDVVVIQYIKNLPSLACSPLVPSTSEGLGMGCDKNTIWVSLLSKEMSSC